MKSSAWCCLIPLVKIRRKSAAATSGHIKRRLCQTVSIEGSHEDFKQSLDMLKQERNTSVRFLCSSSRREKDGGGEASSSRMAEASQQTAVSIASKRLDSGENSSHLIHHDEPHIVQLAIYDVWYAAQQQTYAYQAAN
ncbi:hypothetical protein PO124_34080 [Bacillus licheniformis]|nr:hypothetical protein [Bacillus licheniformis]